MNYKHGKYNSKGFGKNNTGMNLLGLALMDVRKKLIKR